MKRFTFALLVLSLLSLAACGVEKQFLRYHDVEKEVGGVKLQVRLVGTPYSKGALAVGAPYRLFLSIYPGIDKVDSLSIQLLNLDGELVRSFEGVELTREAAYKKEGDFLFMEESSLDIGYEDYVLVVDSKGALSQQPIRMHLIRNETHRRESDWWTQNSSI
jgi:hypothetical protein